MGEIREKCAVVGVFDPNAAELTSVALRVLDHRGPDSTGIGGITETDTFETFHALGRAKEVLTTECVSTLGELGMVAAVGHGRYATSGSANHPIKAGTILYAENGNASDLSLLETDLDRRGISSAHMNDSEMNAWAIGDRVKRGASLVEAIADAYPLMLGGHASVVIGKGLDGEPMMAAYRDPCGIRPLVLGQTINGGYMVASETQGLDEAGVTYVDEIKPGSLVTFSHKGMEEYQLATPNPKYDPFEIIYFSNKNSLFRGQRIGDIRYALGQMLAAEYGSELHGTAVVGVPNSAIPYAEGYAEALGLPHLRKAIQKKTTERTFLGQTAEMRRELRNKIYMHDPIRFRGHDMDVLDDSLVRNNTGGINRKALERVGAKSVSIYIGSPPIRYPNFYGINLPSQADLAAATMSIEQIRQSIGCKRLGYLSLEGMLDTFLELTGVPADHFDLSAFTGDYPISIGNRDIQTVEHAGYVA